MITQIQAAYALFAFGILGSATAAAWCVWQLVRECRKARPVFEPESLHD